MKRFFISSFPRPLSLVPCKQSFAALALTGILIAKRPTKVYARLRAAYTPFV